jgi:pyrroline-5-carboxylate reductase
MTAKSDESGARLAVLGAGNLGQALARGWVESGRFTANGITLTRRQVDKLEELAREGYDVGSDNVAAVSSADTIVVAVQPQQIAGVLAEIRDALDPSRHLLISVVTGVSIDYIADLVGREMRIVRAMPNTAVSIGESMTCLAAHESNQPAVQEAKTLFDLVGATLSIQEEMMVAATALCACGVAFFLRAIRAASQGGIEIGFHPEEALLLAAQTAKGAAAMLSHEGRHPEAEIDRVTTPRGCTIAGLNEMEHQGFSSALIKGILVSATNARALLPGDQG